MNTSSNSLLNVSLNDDIISEFNISEENTAEPNDRDVVINNLMEVYLRHKLTKNAVEDLAKLINSIPGAKFTIPATKHVLFSEFLRNNRHKVYKHILCPKCNEYVQFPYGIAKDAKCVYCQRDLAQNEKFFAIIQTENQLRRIIHDNYDEIIAYKCKLLEKKCDTIEDVFDGNITKEIMKTNYLYTLTMNTDGLIVHQSSHSSLYPILFTCNFLPPEIRFKEKNIIVAGLYYGMDKPDYLKYLEPIVEEFERLGEFGFVEKDTSFKFAVTHGTFDLPIKSLLQQITQYNGYNACYYCDHPGEQTEKGVRYTNMQNNSMRNHENMILTTQNVLKTGKIINGVKGMSPLVGFMHFDLVRSLANDYMHGVCLGVLKNQFDFWFNSNYNKEEYYIKPKQKRIINQRLREIKPCRFINRRITTMDNHSTFKASQCRNFILYFHPVLSGILKKKYFQHFQLLASSIYTLLKTEISCEE